MKINEIAIPKRIVSTVKSHSAQSNAAGYDYSDDVWKDDLDSKIKKFGWSRPISGAYSRV